MKKVAYIQLLPMVVITIISYLVLSKINFLRQAQFFLVSIQPFFWALGIALIMKPVVDYIKGKSKLSDTMSIVVAYALALILIGVFFIIVGPLLIRSIKDLLNTIPVFYKIVADSLPALLAKIPMEELREPLSANITAVFSRINTVINTLSSFVVTGVVNTTSNLITIVFGFLISIYILTRRKYFRRVIRKIVYALQPKENADYILKIGYNAINKFSSFVGGKVIDSTIIGILAFILFTLIKAPYAVILALIVGVTNMIPYFGPFIGAVPAIGISIFYGWQKALLVAVLILLLQQFDGWYLGPKILGDKVGLEPFWIILAVIVGGAYFGPLGMFLGTPFLAVIRDVLSEFLNKRLAKKGLNIDS